MQMEVEKPKTSRSLAATLATAFLAFSVAVLLIASSFEMYTNFQTQREIVAGKQQLVAQDAANTVASFIQEKFSMLKAAAKLGNLVSVSQEEQKRVLGNLLGLQPAFRSLVLLDSQEQALVTVSRLSQAASGSLTDRAGSDLFAQVKQGNRYIGSVYIDEVTSEPLVIMAVPATNVFGDFQGTLMAEVNLKFMWDLVDRLEIGETGLAYVVDRQGNLIAFGDIARVLRGESVGHLREVGEFVSNPAPVDETGANISSGINGTTMIGTYVPLGTPDWAVVTELPVREAYREVIRAAMISAGVMLVMAMLAGLIGVNVARRLAVPLLNLTKTATRIAGGEIGLQAAIEGPTEVAGLAKAFNSMAAQLRELIENLEQRVAERTREYEEAVVHTQQAYAQLHETHQKLEVTTLWAQRRAMQLETAAEVSRAATSVLDPDELVRQAVDLIRERFDLYYAGLFLLDESGRWAMLRAGTGGPGRQMLEAGHKLEVGGRSMVGWCTANAQARIALDVGEEAVRFDNPLLPDTRSEMALPLISRGQVIGALDVQSVEAGAFSDEDIAVLQTMADQIAVAIDNARLFTEAQARLEKVQAAHRSYLRESWDEFLPSRETTDYEYVQPGVTPSKDAMRPRVRQVMAQQRTVLSGSGDGKEEPALAQSALVTPIALRGQVIGALGLQETEGARQWTADEIALVEAVADQMALAIENARLFEEAQRRLREITTLYEASQACLSTSDQKSLLAAIIEAAAQAAGAALGSVMLVDEKKGEYVFGATYGMSEETITAIKAELHIPLEEGLVGAVVTMGQPLVVADVTTDSRWIPWETKEPLRSFLGVPLVSRGGRPLGAITLFHPEVDAFDESHARLLSTFANQAALAIENARLFEAAQARARRERLIREITGKVQGSIDLDAILQTTVQELSKALGASHAVVRLGTEAELATPIAEGQTDSDVGS
jgi:GAF domain-containing protein/HAMP domain-containing protein